MKTYTKLILSLAVFATVSSTASNIAFADGNAFTPLNFDDAAYTAPKAVPAVAPKAQPNAIAKAMSKVVPTQGNAPAAEVATGEIPIGNDNIQNAILELDNAQVGIKNDLLNYKAKYSDIDAQYKLIKNERTMIYRQVKSIERRIKSIDRAKDKIRKNMI